MLPSARWRTRTRLRSGIDCLCRPDDIDQLATHSFVQDETFQRIERPVPWSLLQGGPGMFVTCFPTLRGCRRG